jgi:hypothetical protein
LSIAIGADSPLPMVGYTVPYTAPYGYMSATATLSRPSPELVESVSIRNVAELH